MVAVPIKEYSELQFFNVNHTISHLLPTRPDFSPWGPEVPAPIPRTPTFKVQVTNSTDAQGLGK